MGRAKSRHLPAQTGGMASLAWRLLKTRDPAAQFAMLSVALGVAATPLDLLLQVAEGRLYARAPDACLPLVLVAGPPRSGTTIVAQTLIAHLDVAYFNNLTAVFPRAPIVANRIFGRFLRPATSFHNYYGRTSGLSGVNDALHIWDRWLGPDRTRVPDEITDQQTLEMRRFFGALEASSHKPVVNKNNRLNTCAHLIAARLPQSHFLCLEREPVFLAQSLLQARHDIIGDSTVPYGVDSEGSRLDDPVGDVCRQVRFHREMVLRQLEAIGRSRFWLVSYERFCEEPWRLVTAVGREVLRQPVDEKHLRESLSSFKISNRPRVSAEVFADLNERLADLPELETRV